MRASLVVGYRSLGLVSLRRGELMQAIPPLERAVELCRTIPVRVHFDVSAAYLGYAYALSGRLREGVALLEEALADPAATGIANHSLFLAHLGEAHLLAGRRDDASEVAGRALDLARRQKERGNEAWVLRLLGEIAAQADPPGLASAEEHYGQALARADELGMRPLVAHCHLGLGKLYRRTGDGAKAEEHLTTAASDVPGDGTGTGGIPATDLVASLARPGGNVTGLTLINAELSAKRVALLKEALPSISRVAVLKSARNPSHEPIWKETQRAAALLHLHLQPVDMREPGDLEEAFAAMKRARAEAFILAPDEFFFAHRRRLLELAAKNQLPGVGDTRDFVEVGLFMSYGPSVPQMFRQAATYVDKILKGAKPADLPVEQPTRYDLVINIKTAKALGLTIPPAVLARADEVIQ